MDGSIDNSNRIPELNLHDLDDSSKFGRHNSSRVMKDNKTGMYYEDYDEDNE